LKYDYNNYIKQSSLKGLQLSKYVNSNEKSSFVTNWQDLFIHLMWKRDYTSPMLDHFSIPRHLKWNKRPLTCMRMNWPKSTICIREGYLFVWVCTPICLGFVFCRKMRLSVTCCKLKGHHSIATPVSRPTTIRSYWQMVTTPKGRINHQED